MIWEFRQESQLDFRRIADLRLRPRRLRQDAGYSAPTWLSWESFSCTRDVLPVRANRSQRRGVLRPLQASIPRSGFYRLRSI